MTVRPSFGSWALPQARTSHKETSDRSMFSGQPTMDSSPPGFTPVTGLTASACWFAVTTRGLRPEEFGHPIQPLLIAILLNGDLMKISILILAVMSCGACPEVSAQAGPNVDAVGQWLRDLTEEGVARQQEALLHDAPSAEGAYVVQSIADLDAPPIVKTHFQDEAVARYTGVMTVAMGTIPSVAALMAQTPVRVLSDQILRERLPVPPAGIAGTPLRAARLVNTDWWGTRSGINATGLSRIYLLEGTGFIEFSEDSYRLGAGKIIQFKEALNATVGDTPAMSHMERSVDGRGMAVLSWVTPEKSFQLRLVTDDGASIEKGAELLMQIAEGIDR